MVTSLMQHAYQVRAWEDRRRARGSEPNTDAVWAYIKNRWPMLPDALHEEIFQKCARSRQRAA